MRWYNYKRPLWALLLAVCAVVSAQASEADSLASSCRGDSPFTYDTLLYKNGRLPKELRPRKGTPEYYEYKMQAYNRFWTGLIPNQSRLQFAGSVGMINLGLGWHYGGPQHHRWETDFMLGFLLKNHTPHNHLTFTLRQSYVPFRIPLCWKFSLEPLAAGAMVNFVSGEEFWMREPSKYPQRYYGFPTAVRAHIFIGQRLRWEIPQAKRKYVKAISFCYDLSACDLDLVSYASNTFIPLRDILSLSFSIKVDAF